jgi:DNA-binding transcriptional LysR family regulator
LGAPPTNQDEGTHDEPWVSIPADTPMDDYVVAGLRGIGFTLPAPAVRTYSMHVRNYLISTGRFLGLVWQRTLEFNPSAWSFKALPVKLEISPRPVAIVTLKNRSLSPVVQLFISNAREVAGAVKALPNNSVCVDRNR